MKIHAKIQTQIVGGYSKLWEPSIMLVNDIWLKFVQIPKEKSNNFLKTL